MSVKVMRPTLLRLPEVKLYAPPPPANSVLYLTGYPPMGSTIFDRSGSANHGAISGATWKRLPSGLWVLKFDGSDDVVNCGSAASLDALTGNCAFEAWIKPTSLGENNEGGIIWKSSGNGFLLVMIATAATRFTIVVGGVSKTAIAANNAVPFGSWTRVVGVFNGANVLIYTNLTLVTGAATAGPIDAHSAYGLTIGDNGTSVRCFDGLIALPRGYNETAPFFASVAQTTAFFTQHYQQERHLFGR